jgi:hypothetical protein
MLVAVCGAYFLIIGNSFAFKHLRQHDSSMTGTSVLRASVGAPVDVPIRMDACFADG